MCLVDQADSIVAVGCEGNAIVLYQMVETHHVRLSSNSWPLFEMFRGVPTATLTVASIFNKLMECTLDHFYELWSIAVTVEVEQSSCWSARLGILRCSLDRLHEKPAARSP